MGTEGVYRPSGATRRQEVRTDQAPAKIKLDTSAELGVPRGGYASEYGSISPSARALLGLRYSGEAGSGISPYGARSLDGAIRNPDYKGPDKEWGGGGLMADAVLADLPKQMVPTYTRLTAKKARLQNELDTLNAEKRKLVKEKSEINVRTGKGGGETADGEVTKYELKDEEIKAVNSEIKKIKEEIEDIQERLDSMAGMAFHMKTNMGGPSVPLPS